jgi:ribosome-associated protein
MTAARAYKREDLPAELEAALHAALEVGARAPTVLRVTEIAGYTDWVLIVSGRIERQVSAICSAVEDALAEKGVKPLGKDGTQEGLWGLLDYDDFLVHAFFHPVRNYYDLESMWSDAPRAELGLPADIMDTQDLENLSAPAVMPDYRGDMNFGGFEDEFDDEDDPYDDEEDDHSPTAPISAEESADDLADNSDLFESDDEDE